MRRIFLSSIALAYLLPAHAAFSDIPTAGDPIQSLSIDYERTQSLGAGTVSDPRLFLEVDSEGFWLAPYVIATPNSGVCATGVLTSDLTFDRNEIDDISASLLRSIKEGFDIDYGAHLLAINGEAQEPSATGLSSLLTQTGQARLLTTAETATNAAYSEINLYLDGNIIFGQQIALFENYDDCMAEMPR